jgi:hypothetical protein
MASTGLSIWVNQGTATSTDTSAGLVLSDETPPGGNNARLLCKTAPSTPYSIIALVAHAAGGFSYAGSGLGWRNTSDGKISIMGSLSYNGGSFVAASNYNSPTSWNSFPSQSSSGPIVWIKLKNDGTTVTRYFSMDGVTWITAYTEALVGSFHGSTGYNQICFVTDNTGAAPIGATLMSYQETSP